MINVVFFWFGVNRERETHQQIFDWIMEKGTKNHCNDNERKSEQAHIPHAPTLLENAVYNEWQFQALVMGNRTENQFLTSCTK